MELESFLTYALNIIIIIITFYLIFLTIKSKNLRVYPCYNVLYLSIILFIDNILRLVPTKNMHESLQYSQAFILVCLDKLLLTTLVAQTIIIYLGVCQTNLYFSHEKLIYFSTVFINLLIGSALSIIQFLIQFFFLLILCLQLFYWYILLEKKMMQNLD